MSTSSDLAREAGDYFRRADAEGRPLTASERTTVETLLKDAEVARGEEMRAKLYASGGAPNVTAGAATYGTGPGDRFIQSKGWQQIADPNSRGQTWTTGAVDIGPLGKAGTALESGQGAGLIPVPQVRPGVVPAFFQPLGVADLFAQAQATTSSVRYVTEGTATNAAAGVAEGAEKPASDLAYSTVDEPVKKIATVLTVSDELLEDAPTIQAYLNSRLTLFVRLEEERQILRGAGTNELVGMFAAARGINTYSKLAADDNATALARVIANTAGSSNLEPDAIVMHPNQWLSTRLLRDGTGGTAGQFLGGGPFTGSYGTGGAANAAMFGGMLWNKPVVLSTTVGVGTALVGNFQQGAQLFHRGGVSVEASNSHDSYFRLNLVMLRAERRQALAVYRPSAFTAVSGLA